MSGYKLLYLVSLITFTFGALTFSVLTVVYWRERRRGRRRVFFALTIVCAVAFLVNLTRQIAGAEITALAAIVAVATGLLPALLFHLVIEHETAGRGWRWAAGLLYPLAISAALAGAFVDTDFADHLPAIMLAAAGALGVLAQAFNRREFAPQEKPLRRWYGALLGATVAVAAANLAEPGGVASFLPDYVVLAFFCVTLYYRERLVFFDLLIKRGVYFAVALVALTAFFAVERVPAGWSRPWLCALLLLPLWLLGPWIYNRLASAIDRVWLRRRYSPADAERLFIQEAQAAQSEAELQTRAAKTLSEIFQAPAEIHFESAALLPDDGLSAGGIVLGPRPSMIPYLSDDRRLLQSLAGTLALVRENVRFRQESREQQEREQRLRWLASRAELKALRAQINPHFLFNALNAIAGLIPSRPDLADETVEQLAEVFRYTLRKSDNEWVRLEEEVEFVKAYLRVEQARFGARLETEFAIDPAASGVLVPAMAIQPLIENAIKHGVAAVAGQAAVALRAVVEGDFLSVEVADNGPGFTPDFRAGHGLRNVQERLTGYYGDTARLEWESAGGGARVRLKIPLAEVRREHARAHSG